MYVHTGCFINHATTAIYAIVIVKKCLKRSVRKIGDGRVDWARVLEGQEALWLDHPSEAMLPPQTNALDHVERPATVFRLVATIEKCLL